MLGNFLRKAANDAAWRVITIGLGLAYEFVLRDEPQPEPTGIRHVWREGGRCLCGLPAAGARTTTILARSACLACWDADVVLLSIDVADALRRAGRTIEAAGMVAAAERGPFAAAMALSTMGDAGLRRLNPSLARRWAARNAPDTGERR